MALMYDGANAPLSSADQLVFRSDGNGSFSGIDYYSQGKLIGHKDTPQEYWDNIDRRAYDRSYAHPNSIDDVRDSSYFIDGDTGEDLSLDEASRRLFGDSSSDSDKENNYLQYFQDFMRDIVTDFNVAQNALSTSVLQAQKDEADYNRFWNAEQAAISRQFSADEADKARRWQAMREDTAYQRVVKDLTAAGLNPILAYQFVNPSTGSAQMASTVSASGTQANLSSAKNADKVAIDDLLPMIIIPLATSALALLNDMSKKEFKFSLF